MNAIRVTQTGGPEALALHKIDRPHPRASEALVKVLVAGVNFIDIYHRTGHYKLPIPFTPGMEGAGVIEAVGDEVAELRVGQRVAWAMHIGGYAQYAVIPAWKLVSPPDAVSDDIAAAAMLQGMTAHFLTHSTFAIKAGSVALVHAAAGGVGLLLVQMIKKRGGTVIGTVSTEEKAMLARSAGADHIIRYTEADFEAETKKIAPGGVDVVYDSVGQATFDKSLNCLRPRGVLVLFGGSSGPVAPIDPLVLSAKGSLFLTRPTLLHHAVTREELLSRAGDVLRWVADGSLNVRIDRVYPLTEAAQAHRDLESRKTAGKLLLHPFRP